MNWLDLARAGENCPQATERSFSAHERAKWERAAEYTNRSGGTAPGCEPGDLPDYPGVTAGKDEHDRAREREEAEWGFPMPLADDAPIDWKIALRARDERIAALAIERGYLRRALERIAADLGLDEESFPVPTDAGEIVSFRQVIRGRIADLERRLSKQAHVFEIACKASDDKTARISALEAENERLKQLVSEYRACDEILNDALSRPTHTSAVPVWEAGGGTGSEPGAATVGRAADVPTPAARWSEEQYGSRPTPNEMADTLGRELRKHEVYLTRDSEENLVAKMLSTFTSRWTDEQRQAARLVLESGDALKPNCGVSNVHAACAEIAKHARISALEAENERLRAERAPAGETKTAESVIQAGGNPVKDEAPRKGPTDSASPAPAWTEEQRSAAHRIWCRAQGVREFIDSPKDLCAEIAKHASKFVKPRRITREELEKAVRSAWRVSWPTLDYDHAYVPNTWKEEPRNMVSAALSALGIEVEDA